MLCASLLVLPGMTQAATYNNFIFTCHLTDAAGNLIPTTSSSGHTTCVGGKIYLKNTSFLGCNAANIIGGVGLQGTIRIYNSTSTFVWYYPVTNAPGGTWNGNELLEVPMNIVSGTSIDFLYAQYYPISGEVWTSTCIEGPLQDFAYYGRIVPGPSITATASPASICAGASTTLTAGGATTYSWTPGPVSGSSISVSPATTSTYTVTGTGSYGCTASKTVTVTVNPTPAPPARDVYLCPGDAWPTFSAGSGGTSYSWTYNGNLASTMQTVNTALYGYGTYVATVTNSYGCTGTGTYHVWPDPSGTPNAGFNFSLSTTSSMAQISVTAMASNTNNTWELYTSNSSGAMGTYIEGTSYAPGGNTHTFSTWVADNNWYRINHTVSTEPCLTPGSNYRYFFISDIRRLSNPDTGSTPGQAFAAIDFITYPNPGNGLLNIKVNSSLDDAPMQFSVMDITGRVVAADLQCAPGSEIQIDLSQYGTGVYLLRAQSQQESMTTKIIVE